MLLTLSEVLIQFGEDPLKRDAFLRDPDAYVADLDLDEEQKAVLKSNNQNALRQAVVNEVLLRMRAAATDAPSG